MPKATADKKPAQRKVIVPEVLPPADEAEEKKRTVKKAVTNTRVERFVEEVPADDLDAGDLDDDLTDDADDDELEPPKSDIELLLEEHDNNNEFWLRVERLTNYEIDGRRDAAAARQFCMNISPVTLEYEDIIARSFGGGAYIVKLYRRGYKGTVRYWSTEIAKGARAAAEQVAPAAQAAAAAAPQPGAVVDPIRAKLDSLMLRQFDRALEATANPAPARSLPAAEPPPSPATQIKETIELYKEITSITPQGESSKGDSIGVTLVKEVFGFLRPIAQPLAQMTLAAMMQKPNGTAQQPPTFQPPQGALPPQQSEQPAQPAEPDPLTTLLARLCEDCTRDPESEGIEQAAQYVTEFRAANPNLEPVIARVLSMSSAEILLFIAQSMPLYGYVMKLKHASAWIENLQDELRAEDEGEEGSGEEESPAQEGE